jgi:NAD+ synthase
MLPPTGSLPPLAAVPEVDRGSEWLRKHLADAGASRFVIGLSGGIDSAVVATWAVRALGGEPVTTVSMPYGLLHESLYHPSAVTSLEHARLVIARLPGIDHRELDIAPTVDAEAETTGLADDLRRAPEDVKLLLALANIKARVRAVRLRYFANRLNGLVLGTENKTEHYLGYFTIGGDEESDLELLGNYLKAEVVELATALELPRAIIEKPPSADLWTGQTDEAELGFTYRDADHVLHVTNCSSELTADAAARCRADTKVASRVLERVRATEFKRAPKPVFPRLPTTR